ncbi:hypothetical protein, partial [Halococcus agarilyticus]|uniref:hypothetical protein n=1 Tax=Halococcus agarilyticus TaxID=1232219 RepID=UPI001E3A94CC
MEVSSRHYVEVQGVTPYVYPLESQVYKSFGEFMTVLKYDRAGTAGVLMKSEISGKKMLRFLLVELPYPASGRFLTTK